MAADTLIWKKRGRRFSATIKKGMQNNHTPESYHMVVNLNNYKDLGLFLHDLKFLHNAPMDKAIRHMKDEEGNWPF